MSRKVNFVAAAADETKSTISDDVAWGLLLRARASLITRGATPGVWTKRIPYPDEIQELYRILTIEGKLPAGEVVDKLIAAIQDGDKERGGPSFRDTAPKTMGELEIIQRMELTK
jgi:hypothetical protein